MSTSSPPATQSMRQQLDELDALLQRMLNLPVNQLDESGEPTLQHARFRNTADPAPTPPPPVGRRPSMMLLDGSAPVAPPASPPNAWDPNWHINLNPQQGSSVFGPRGPAAQRAAAAEPSTPIWRAETVGLPQRETTPAPQPPLATARDETSPTPSVTPNRAPAPEPAPLALLPVVAVNRAFDAVMLTFGGPGEWLCTRVGRAALGFAGLALLMGSTGWAVATWFGWPR